MKADHAKTKDYCMTRFCGHGQSILHVFETPITLNMMESVKCHLFPTLLVPISWALAIQYVKELRERPTEAYALADEHARAQLKSNKGRYDRRVRPSGLEVGGRILLRNVAITRNVN